MAAISSWRAINHPLVDRATHCFGRGSSRTHLGGKRARVTESDRRVPSSEAKSTWHSNRLERLYLFGCSCHYILHPLLGDYFGNQGLTTKAFRAEDLQFALNTQKGATTNFDHFSVDKGAGWRCAVSGAEFAVFGA